MYTQQFNDLVSQACKESDKYYSEQNKVTVNPFYIGFGNPNSKILIAGQEKAISKDHTLPVESESKDNPYQWKEIIEKGIDNIDYRFYNFDNPFKNPLHPYNEAPRRGNTWIYYQRLMNIILPDLQNEVINNSFFKEAFITEINHHISQRQIGNQRDNLRNKITNHEFYKSFNVTLIAAGNYLSRKEIENKFEVNFIKDISEPRKKLVIYKNINQERILINTRQLSQDVSNEYLNKIAEVVKDYINQ